MLLLEDQLSTTQMDESSRQEVLARQLSPRDQRVLVFHVLYAADSFDYQISLEALAQSFEHGFGYVIKPEDQVFVQSAAVISEREQLDQEFKPLLDNWRYERLGVCTRLILRLGVWELKHTDVDVRVIINEAVELAKAFAELDAYRFVNGVLDQWLKNHPERMPKDGVLEEAPVSEEASQNKDAHDA